MGYAAPIADAVNFDFTGTGYSAPVSSAVDFDFSAAIILEIPCEAIRLLSRIPFAIPFFIPVEVLQLARLNPTYSGPGVGISVAAGLLILQGFAPGLQASMDLDQDSLGLLDFQPTHGRAISVPVGSLILADQLPAIANSLAMPFETLQLYQRGPSYPVWWNMPAELLRVLQAQPHYFWRIPDPSIAQTVYTFTLTGSPDVVIPVSSIQMRRRDGDPTYISVVVPDYDYAAVIAARANGEMIIKKGFMFADGTFTLQEIARADLESIRIDRGGRNASISLSGHKTVATVTPKTVALEGASYRNFSDGKRRYRCGVDLWLQPGDTVEVNGESFTAGMITYTIGTRQEVMEIGEG